MENYLTLTQAGELYNISPSTIRKMFNCPEKFRKMDGIEEGKDYFKIAKTWFVSKEAMEKMYGKKGDS